MFANRFYSVYLLFLKLITTICSKWKTLFAFFICCCATHQIGTCKEEKWSLKRSLLQPICKLFWFSISIKDSKKISSFADASSPCFLKTYNQITCIFRSKFDVSHRHIVYKRKNNASVSTENEKSNCLWVAFDNKNRVFVDFTKK